VVDVVHPGLGQEQPEASVRGTAGRVQGRQRLDEEPSDLLVELVDRTLPEA
jgi:hypothetical protein